MRASPVRWSLWLLAFAVALAALGTWVLWQGRPDDGRADTPPSAPPDAPSEGGAGRQRLVRGPGVPWRHRTIRSRGSPAARRVHDVADARSARERLRYPAYRALATDCATTRHSRGPRIAALPGVSYDTGSGHGAGQRGCRRADPCRTEYRRRLRGVPRQRDALARRAHGKELGVVRCCGQARTRYDRGRQSGGARPALRRLPRRGLAKRQRAD